MSSSSAAILPNYKGDILTRESDPRIRCLNSWVIPFPYFSGEDVYVDIARATQQYRLILRHTYRPRTEEHCS
jgi:hypothetical protein